MTLVYVNNDNEGTGTAEVRRALSAASRVRLAEAGGQGGVALPGPEERLPRRVVDDDQAAVWWLGAHGGAGESTLEELFSGSRAAEHSWPLTAAERPPARVVLVARTHARGLVAAQSAIREWAAGDVPVLLLGLVLIADAPGPAPARPAAAGGSDRRWRPDRVVAAVDRGLASGGAAGAAQRTEGRPPAPRGPARPDRGGRLGERQPKGLAMLHLLTLAVVDPGQGVAPPGAGKLTTILQWTAWGVFALCVGGVLISAAKLAHSHNQGYGGANQHTTSLVWTLVACVIAGSSAAIVGALS